MTVEKVIDSRRSIFLFIKTIFFSGPMNAHIIFEGVFIGGSNFNAHIIFEGVFIGGSNFNAHIIVEGVEF